MSGDKLSLENAEDQVELLLEKYDIDRADIDDEGQLSGFDGAYKKLVKAVQRGRLEIIVDPEFQVIQHLKYGGSDITYRELDGKAKVAMGTRKSDDMHGRIYSMLGSLSGFGFNAIQELKGSDLGVAESLGIIFLSA